MNKFYYSIYYYEHGLLYVETPASRFDQNNIIEFFLSNNEDILLHSLLL